MRIYPLFIVVWGQYDIYYFSEIIPKTIDKIKVVG